MSPQLFAYLLEGLLTTLQLTIGAAALGLVFSFAAGIATCSPNIVVRGAGRCYIELFRGISALVLLFWFVFALPYAGWQLDPMWAGILALALNIGAYGAEVVRGGIVAVPVAQIEAAVALNFTRAQRMRLVVLPQAIARMLPPFGNLLIELLKGTSVAYIVLIPDLTFAGQIVRNATGDSASVFTALLILYAVLAVIFTTIVRLIERRVAKSLGRPPTPGFFARIKGVKSA
ncbi:ectoine/hydroxyectoine ABC transporter permease subunit EhuC [Allokutzneria sp. A3M-2-11 16]|uniref:ectoine/hydroxyectoine ABC transporter permease subunit EhuC n=1 Tax=Allokutzneria sp. A3M-2-11 16 TaxID=2962043 RepID=UPI0020B698B6|nr:ectoine/hydroxyectoine ABC transporter permease subunit EhuC [Allokutzneria sp. A3M-2-11 16]MCP3798245.1 ectoine/hydroxyectoine ABC transporter permease subunit EhuC [Allokutzneria sp. A3M-2-11 16]